MSDLDVIRVETFLLGVVGNRTTAGPSHLGIDRRIGLQIPKHIIADCACKDKVAGIFNDKVAGITTDVNGIVSSNCTATCLCPCAGTTNETGSRKGTTIVVVVEVFIFVLHFVSDIPVTWVGSISWRIIDQAGRGIFLFTRLIESWVVGSILMITGHLFSFFIPMVSFYHRTVVRLDELLVVIFFCHRMAENLPSMVI